MPTSAVLFDIDGTLADTNYLHTMAWRRAMLDAGADVATARIHRMIGDSGSVLMTELLGREDDEVKDGWRRHFDALKDEVRSFPGAAELLRAVAARGPKIVLATSSEPDDADFLRTAIDAEDVIFAVTTSGDVDRAKPAPDVFEVALERAGAVSNNAIVVGDSVWDVAAATRAGLRTVALRCGGYGQAELESAGAVATYEDPSALLAVLDDSPLAELWESVRWRRRTVVTRPRVSQPYWLPCRGASEWSGPVG